MGAPHQVLNFPRVESESRREAEPPSPDERTGLNGSAEKLSEPVRLRKDPDRPIRGGSCSVAQCKPMARCQ